MLSAARKRQRQRQRALERHRDGREPASDQGRDDHGQHEDQGGDLGRQVGMERAEHEDHQHDERRPHAEADPWPLVVEEVHAAHHAYGQPQALRGSGKGPCSSSTKMV